MPEVSREEPGWGVTLLTARTHRKGAKPRATRQERLGRRLEVVVRAVPGGYCRLQIPSGWSKGRQQLHPRKELPPLFHASLAEGVVMHSLSKKP